MDTARGYTGQYADTLTGLDYYVSRYYDPVVGIFLSPDVKEGNAAGMNPYAYVAGNPETDTDPSGQYYSNGTQLGESGGETAYVYNNEVVTVTNNGRGVYYPLYGPASWNYGSLYINVSTSEQFNRYGSYNSATDPQYSTATKFAAVTGWTQLQQSWNAPDATTQSRLAALGKFAGTNINNVLQLAAVFGGPEDEGVAAAADALETAADETVTAATDTVSTVDADTTAADEVTGPVNSRGDPYPQMTDPRTGQDVPFPEGSLQKVPKGERVLWNNITRGEFIKQWYDNGFTTPEGGWDNFDIHHILPREYGGTNDFSNLVPLERGFHQTIVTPWWNAYNP